MTNAQTAQATNTHINPVSPSVVTEKTASKVDFMGLFAQNYKAKLQ